MIIMIMIIMSVQAKTGESEASGADQGSMKSSLVSSPIVTLVVEMGCMFVTFIFCSYVHTSVFRNWGERVFNLC